MKRILPALRVLSVLAGIAAPTNALDTKTFWCSRSASSIEAQRGSRRGEAPRPSLAAVPEAQRQSSISDPLGPIGPATEPALPGMGGPSAPQRPL
jgi:hypothetical protein